MEIINILLFTLVCLVISYFFSRWRHHTHKAVNNVPGPTAYPLIGSAYMFFNKKIDECLNIILALGNKYGYPLRLVLGNRRVIFINDVDHIKIILQNKQCLNKSIFYKFLPFFGNGLVTVQATEWHSHRKNLSPAFNINMLKTFFDIFIKESLSLIEELQKDELHGKEIIYWDLLLECTLSIAYDIIGLNVTKESKTIKQFAKILSRGKENFALTRASNIVLYPSIIFYYSSTSRKHRKNMEFIQSLLNKAIQQESSVHKATNIENKQNTIFDILINISQKKQLTHQDICDHILTMFMTASDAPAVILNFLIFLLANFPEIQDKVYEELQHIYGLSTQNPKLAQIQYDDLIRMKYLERVVKETLRLFPVVPLIGRHLTEDLQLGELIVPQGTDIAINIAHLHRSEKYWPDPLLFNPDRFLTDNTTKRNYYSYIPFSSGLRNCIGTGYAMMSIKIIVATLLRAFVFKVDKNVKIDEIQVASDFTIHSLKPLKVKFEKRSLI